MLKLSLVSSVNYVFDIIPRGHLYIISWSESNPHDDSLKFVWRGGPSAKGYKWYDPITGGGGSGNVVFDEKEVVFTQSIENPAHPNYGGGTLFASHLRTFTTLEDEHEYNLIKLGFEEAHNFVNSGNYPYNYLYQNSNTVVRLALEAANENLVDGGFDPLDLSLPDDGAWTPAYYSSVSSTPFTGNYITLIPTLLYEASLWAIQQGENIVDFIYDRFTSVRDWMQSFSTSESIDVTTFANDMDFMLEEILKLEKGYDVAVQLGDGNADEIFAGAAQDWLLGGGGDDIFHSAAGNDSMIGGEGIDLVSFLTSDTGLTIDLENEYSSAGSGVIKDSLFDIENVTGTDFADVIRGTDGQNTLTGGKGDDNLFSRGGKDTFMHAIGDGNDILHGFANDLSDVFMEFADPDDVYLNVYSQDLYVTNGATGEQIRLKNQYSDTVSGFEFSTLNGDDITGGLTIRGTSPTAAEIVHGTIYADTIDGGLGDDTLHGWGGSNVYIHNVGDGNDQLYELEGAQSSVLMNGVAANDLYFNVYLEDLIVTNVATGEQLYLNNQYANPDAVKEFASVNGINVNYGLTIKGTSATLGEIIHGTKYADTIIGGLGDDIIYGMGSADTFIHNSGDGSDYLHAQSLNELATVTLSISNDDIAFNVIGNDLRVTDTTSGNVLYLKNQHKDESQGYEFQYVNNIDVTGGLEISGTGSLYGTIGNDTLEGNHTNQTIKGDDGDDVFISSGGKDNLYGEGGNDRFVFDSLTDSAGSAAHNIWGFVRGEDKIDFSQLGKRK